MHSYKCKNCGFVQTGDEYPSACRVCGKGVVFTPGQPWKHDKANWEPQGDAPPDPPEEALRAGRVVSAAAGDRPESKDR